MTIHTDRCGLPNLSCTGVSVTITSKFHFPTALRLTGSSACTLHPNGHGGNVGGTLKAGRDRGVIGAVITGVITGPVREKCRRFPIFRRHAPTIGPSQRVACGLSRCEAAAMRACSKDLRLKVLAAVDRGMPRAAVVDASSMSPATVERWLKRRRETGGVDPAPIPGPPAPKPPGAGRAATRARANPEPHPRRARRALRAGRGGAGLDGHGGPRLQEAGAAAQRKPLPASERDEAEKALRREGIGRPDPGRLAFVDECGTHASMTRVRARAPKGERAYDGKAPRRTAAGTRRRSRA